MPAQKKEFHVAQKKFHLGLFASSEKNVCTQNDQTQFGYKGLYQRKFFQGTLKLGFKGRTVSFITQLMPDAGKKF